VLIYCHQDPVADAAKYRVIRAEFHEWLQARGGARPGKAARRD
jgi:hypothetical protein